MLGLLENVKDRLFEALENMSLSKWIRLVVIVGGYLLLRPYLLKLGARTQMKEHEKSDSDTKAKTSAVDLQSKVDIPEDTDDEEEVPAAEAAAKWGKKARRRQRTVIKKLLEAEEERLQEQQADDDDEDIKEFLED